MKILRFKLLLSSLMVGWLGLNNEILAAPKLGSFGSKSFSEIRCNSQIDSGYIYPLLQVKQSNHVSNWINPKHLKGDGRLARQFWLPYWNRLDKGTIPVVASPNKTKQFIAGVSDRVVFRKNSLEVTVCRVGSRPQVFYRFFNKTDFLNQINNIYPGKLTFKFNLRRNERLALDGESEIAILSHQPNLVDVYDGYQIVDRFGSVKVKDARGMPIAYEFRVISRDSAVLVLNSDHVKHRAYPIVIEAGFVKGLPATLSAAQQQRVVAVTKKHSKCFLGSGKRK